MDGRAFRAILEDWRETLRARGEDPFGDTATHEISKSRLDKVLAGGDPLSAGLVHTAVEEYAVELATVVRRFLRLKTWHGTERIVVGGGLSASHIGELAMGRAAVLLAGESVTVELLPVANHPDKAGLIGAVHVAPNWALAGHDAILAIDIGGTNIRVGVVDLKMKKSGDVTRAAVWRHLHWRHRDDEPTREEALERMVSMAGELAGRASCKVERAGEHGRCRTLGRAHHRHRSGQRPIHQPDGPAGGFMRNSNHDISQSSIAAFSSRG
jgi:sugar (pentulose or hexulose) kinase